MTFYDSADDIKDVEEHIGKGLVNDLELFTNLEQLKNSPYVEMGEKIFKITITIEEVLSGDVQQVQQVQEVQVAGTPLIPAIEWPQFDPKAGDFGTEEEFLKKYTQE